MSFSSNPCSGEVVSELGLFSGCFGIFCAALIDCQGQGGVFELARFACFDIFADIRNLSMFSTSLDTCVSGDGQDRRF